MKLSATNGHNSSGDKSSSCPSSQCSVTQLLMTLHSYCVCVSFAADLTTGIVPSSQCQKLQHKLWKLTGLSTFGTGDFAWTAADQEWPVLSSFEWDWERRPVSSWGPWHSWSEHDRSLHTAMATAISVKHTQLALALRAGLTRTNRHPLPKAVHTFPYWTRPKEIFWEMKIFS